MGYSQFGLDFGGKLFVLPGLWRVGVAKFLIAEVDIGGSGRAKRAMPTLAAKARRTWGTRILRFRGESWLLFRFELSE